jgi:hypothetical protein
MKEVAKLAYAHESQHFERRVLRVGRERPRFACHSNEHARSGRQVVTESALRGRNERHVSAPKKRYARKLAA